MKEYTYTELELYENYFFVYDGVVYYGQAVKSDWDEENKPTHFTVTMSYENDKEICNIWDATLIYQL